MYIAERNEIRIEFVKKMIRLRVIFCYFLLVIGLSFSLYLEVNKQLNGLDWL